MSGNQLSLARRAQSVLSRIVPDRRRHKRVSVTMLGRFMRENKQEYPCSLLDMSVGGAAIMAPVTVEIGEHVVVYFDHVGGIERYRSARVRRRICFQNPGHAAQAREACRAAAWLANRSELGDPGVHTSASSRAAVNPPCSLLDGNTLNCRVLDVSISGASVATTAQPEIGSEVVLGKLRARVVRHHAEGIGLRFIDIQNPTALRRHFGRHESVSDKA
jgi:hypothetical protein